MKRFFDLLGAALGLLIQAPVIAIIAWRVRRSYRFACLISATASGAQWKALRTDQISYHSRRCLSVWQTIA